MPEAFSGGGESPAVTGFDKMAQQILTEAQQAGDMRLAEADQKASAMAEEARAAVADQTEAIVREAKEEQEGILRAARSSAALLVRNAQLRQRRHELDEALSATFTYLEELPADEYFAQLGPLLEKSIQPGKGVLRLCERDLARLPADFGETVSAMIQRRGLDGSVEVSKTPVPIDGGFLLQYGDVEINASFAALAEEKREMLEDLFNRELFAQSAE